MYLVSACLAGVKCRYDGNDNLVPEIRKLVEEGKAFMVCPEVMAGLSVPRPPCEIRQVAEGDKVFDATGKDLTDAFKKGAEMTLSKAIEIKADAAILKYRSPSCGCGKIYDGTFSGKQIDGDGFTVRLLKGNGIRVYCEKDIVLLGLKQPED
jgi:uncharacterized protein YbbK (DUF523 family)